MVTDDNGGSDGRDVFVNIDFKARCDGLKKTKHPLVKNMVQSLYPKFPVGRKQHSQGVERGKKEHEANGEVSPQNQGHGDVGNRFQNGWDGLHIIQAS